MLEVPEAKQRLRFALGVNLLQQTLAQSREPDFCLLPPRSFYPLAPVISDHWFRVRPRLPELNEVLGVETFVVHWYGSILTAELLPFINADYVRQHADCQLFSALALPLLEPDHQCETATMPFPDAPSSEQRPRPIRDLAADSADDASFDRRGYLSPSRVLTAPQCALLEKHFKLGREIEPADWWNGRAVTDRLLFDIASSEPLLTLLRPVLGDNIVLWGASTVERCHGERHAWHVDAESSAPDGHFATVWIGLRNTSRESGLKLIGGSHCYPKILQEVQHANGYRRGEADDATVLDWARAFDPAAEIALPDVSDGDAIVFDGRL